MNRADARTHRQVRHALALGQARDHKAAVRDPEIGTSSFYRACDLTGVKRAPASANECRIPEEKS